LPDVTNWHGFYLNADLFGKGCSRDDFRNQSFQVRHFSGTNYYRLRAGKWKRKVEFWVELDAASEARRRANRPFLQSPLLKLKRPS
jgi:hypothetical protein